MRRERANSSMARCSMAEASACDRFLQDRPVLAAPEASAQAEVSVVVAAVEVVDPATAQGLRGQAGVQVRSSVGLRLAMIRTARCT
jgi:hypothetical protein